MGSLFGIEVHMRKIITLPVKATASASAPQAAPAATSTQVHPAVPIRRPPALVRDRWTNELASVDVKAPVARPPDPRLRCSGPTAPSVWLVADSSR